MHIDDIQICGGTTLLFHRSDDFEESPDCKNKSGNGSDTSDQNEQRKSKFVVQTLRVYPETGIVVSAIFSES